MRVISLASSSSGNALLVEAGPLGRTKLLVDAGLSTRLLLERLRLAGVSPTQLQGVLITHEHSDHVQGLPTLMKYYALPVITDPRTFRSLVESMAAGAWRTEAGNLRAIEFAVHDVIAGDVAISSFHENFSMNGKKIARQSMLPLAVGGSCTVGDIEITSFPVSHDAVAPCGYFLSTGGCRVCIVTDSGEVTPVMLEAIQQADLLILEANHDRELLLRGPYPQRLKQRILSPTGHLSNQQAAEALLRAWRFDSVRWLWLAHLSRTNNTPDLALNSIRTSLRAAGANLAQIHISVMPPDMGAMWDSTQVWSAPLLWDMSG
ncbi:MAG: MBL fold metallo-hydrolase [Ktedonobacteraceae bacterium]|nr:MBL fold metallo-hydrolase [Ktedonobacteraceae bacterium]